MAHSAIMSVRITGNADDAIKALGKVTAKASAFGSAVGNLAAQGVEKLWDSVKNLAGSAVDMSDSVQKFQSTMSFAGLDTSAIQQAQADTRAYADKTVYDLGTVQNTTAQLAANGVKDYTRLTQAAGNVNAVAGGNADTFKSVAMVLTQTAGAGKLTTENWNQLSDAIPGASGKIQEALQKNGAYTGNFRDAMAKGEITADEFNKALLDIGFTDAAQQAATSTSTMEGAMGNLEAAVTGGLSDAFDLIKPTVTGAMSDMADAISQGTGTAIQWLKDFASSLGNTGALDRFKDALGTLGTAFGTLKDAAARILDPFTGLIGKAQEAIKPLSDAGTAGQKAGDLLDGASKVVKGLADTLTSLSNWFDQHAQSIQTSLAAIAGGFAAFKVATVINSVVTALQGFSLASGAATIAQYALNLAMSLNPIMIIVTTLGALTAGLAWFFTQTDDGKQKWSDFCATVQGLWNDLTNWLSQIPGKIGGFFSGIGSWFGDKFNEAKDGITNAFQGAVDWVQGVPDKITGFFGNIGGWFSSKFSEVKDGITGKFQEAIDWIKGVPGQITGFFGNAGDWLKDAGSKIIGGLFQGLKDKWEDVKGWIGGIGDWITQHKGPPSYDAIMLRRNGQLIMQGLARGMREGFTGNVRDTLDSVTRSLASTTFSVGGLAGGTIRPTSQARPIAITINGAIGDRERLAQYIQQTLDQYAARRN